MNTVGLSLHRQIHLNLIDASPCDVQTVMRATGACKTSENHFPDIEIHFVSEPIHDVAWRHLGQRDVLYADGRFALDSGDVNGPIELEMPDEFGTLPFRLTCPTGTRRFPLLRSMINGKSVGGEWLGIHGTAFTYANRGFIACGWPRGGKTGTLLSFLLNDATYLAAEWVYVSDDGETMNGVPETVRLRDWHLRQGAHQLRRINWQDRSRLSTQRLAAKTAKVLARMANAVSPKVGKSTHKIAAAIDRRRYIDRSICDWLGQELQTRSAVCDTILFVGTHDSSDIRVTAIDTEDAKRRLVALQDADMSDLRDAYRRWSYAISDASDWLESFERKRDELLDRMLLGKTAYAVDHPHEVKLADLFTSIASLKEPCLQLH